MVKSRIYPVKGAAIFLLSLAPLVQAQTNYISDASILRIGSTGKEVGILTNTVATITEKLTVGHSSSGVGSELIVHDGTTLKLGTTASTNTNGIIVGKTTTGISVLDVKRESTATAQNLYMGDTADAEAQVIITDKSKLNIANLVEIGKVASNNKLTISDHSELNVNGLITIGTTNSSGNTVSIDSGSTLKVSDINDITVADNNSLTVQGTLSTGGTYTDQDYAAKNINITAGTIRVEERLEGTLNRGNRTYLSEGADWTDTTGTNRYIGQLAGKINRVTMASTNLTITGNLVIADDAGTDNNTLQLTDNAKVTVQSLYLAPQGSQNSVTIESNAVFTASDSIIIGQENNATGNSLTLKDQAQLNTTDLTVGVAGKQNRFKQFGGTATLTGDLLVGTDKTSTGNSVEITNGTFNAANVILGQDGSGSFSVKGGTVNIANDFTVAMTTNSAGGSFTQEGGTVTVNNFILGAEGSTAASSIKNSNSTFAAQNNIYVGQNSSNQKLTIQNGATVTTTNLFISNNGVAGSHPALSNNTIVVTQNKAKLYVHNDLNIGTTNSTESGITVNDGGILFVGGEINLAENQAVTNGSANYLALKSGSTLQVMNWNFTNENRQVSLEKGTTLELGSDQPLAGLSNNVSFTDGRILALNGSLSTHGLTWNTGTNDLVIGDTTGTNQLHIHEGAILVSKNLLLASDQNTLTLSGSNTTAFISNDLFIGTNGSNNRVELSDNAALNVGRDLVIGSYTNGVDNELKLTDATLNVTNNLIVGYKGTSAGFVLSSNVTANILGNLTIGEEGSNAKLEVTGSNNTLNVHTDLIIGATTNSTGNTGLVNAGTLSVNNNLIVGANGGNNSLTLTGGAQTAVLADLLIGTNSAKNSLYLSGTNSMLTVGNRLVIGNNNGFDENRLSVYNAATLRAGQLYLHNGSLNIYNASASVDQYHQDADSTLNITVSTNYSGINLVADTAEFEKGAKMFIHFDSSISASSSNLSHTLVFATNGITIANQAANTRLLNDELLGENLLYDFNAFVTNNNSIYIDQVTRYALSDRANLDGMLANVADELEAMAPSNSAANAMILAMQEYDSVKANQTMTALYDEKQSASPMHNVVNQSIADFVGELHVRGDSTRKRKANADTEAAAGPHSSGQSLEGWLTAYGAWGDRDAGGGYKSYNSDIKGFILGADFSVAPNLLVGVAGGTANSTTSGHGTSGDADSRLFALYGSMGTEDWFFDGSFVYGNSSIKNRLGTAFNTTSSYSAKNMAFYLGGGKEFIGNYLILTPKASLLMNLYDQDGYTEESSGVGRSVDGFDALYLQSSIGVDAAFYIAMGNATLKPNIRLHWLHEFNADEESVNYRLINGTYNVQMQAPESDLIQLGAGIAAQLSEYFQVRVDLDLRQGTEYSDHRLSGTLRYEF
jgi:uncharacterized protein with beta-barrel porin domain